MVAGAREADAPHEQVFVDDSGRRRTWSRAAGVAVGVGCLLYVAVILIGLSQTKSGPMVAVPTTGNGLVPGLPAPGGEVPGLLVPTTVVATPSRPASASRRPTVRLTVWPIPAIVVPTTRVTAAPTTTPLTTTPRTTTPRTTTSRTTTPRPTTSDASSSPTTTSSSRASTSARATTGNAG